MKRYTLATVTALLVLAPWHRAIRADAPLYSVENLGSFSGLVPAVVGINASGQVAGNVPIAGSQAVRYTDGAGWQPLSGLPAGFSVATAINAAGDIAGWRITSTGQFRAFRYRDGFGSEDIAPLPGGSMTFALGINDTGDVVGYGDSASGIVPIRASVGLPATVLPSLNGGFAYGCGINASGQVAGISMVPDGAQHGMRVDPGAPFALDLASPGDASKTVTTCAIDADGRVGGQADLDSGVTHAVRFSGGGAIDLDTFGSPLSNVEAIAAGVSAGWYQSADGSDRAFAHTDADGSFDLNTRIDAAGWVLAQAKGVNENGVIAGQGTFNGADAVFRLTPAGDTTAPAISSVTATPASIFPPKGQLVPVTVTVSATDDSGAAPVCSLSSITGPGTSPTDFNVTGPLSGTVLAVGGRTYLFNVACVDAANNSASSSVAVFVQPDTTAPAITSLAAQPGSIWPANNHWVGVSLSVSATDDVDESPACGLAGVTGAPSSDVVITGPLHANVRASRNEDGSVRTYLFDVACSDAAGNASHAAVSVSVGKDATTKVYGRAKRQRGSTACLRCDGSGIPRSRIPHP